MIVIGVDWGGVDRLAAAVVEIGAGGERRIVAQAFGEQDVAALLKGRETTSAIIGERADLARMVRAGLIKGGAA